MTPQWSCAGSNCGQGANTEDIVSEVGVFISSDVSINVLALDRGERSIE